MKISEITRLCGYEYCGPDREVDSVRFSKSADCNSIAIIKKPEEIENTKARCVLVSPCIVNTDKTIIYTCDPIEFAAVKIAKTIIGKEQPAKGMPIEYEPVKNYFVGKNVRIGNGTVVSPNVYIEDDVRIGDNCTIAPNVHIGRGTVIGNHVKIGTGSSVGAGSFYHYFDESLKEFEGLGIVVVEDEVTVGNSTTIQRGTFSDTVIGRGCKIGNLIDIGHDVVIGKDTKIVSQTGVASHVSIGDNVLIYGQVGIANGVYVGNNSIVYGKSLVTKDVKENQRVSGQYAREHIEELKIQAKLRKR